jgi:putative alpha-1,2-mannosidase
MHGLIDLMGGAEVFTRKLDTFFYERGKVLT